MQISFAIFITVIIVLFVLMPIVIINFNKNEKFVFIFRIVAFVSFSILIFILTIAKVDISNNVSIQFDFTNHWFNKNVWMFEKFELVDAIINLTMLSPLGILLLNKKKSIIYNIILCALVGLIFGVVIESLQYILPVYRTVQIQDIIFNTISSLIGLVSMIVVDWIMKITKKRERNNG